MPSRPRPASGERVEIEAAIRAVDARPDPLRARAAAGVIDPTAPGLVPCDLIFVFGTRLPEPALIAADLFHAGMAPRVLVTGGSARQADGLHEAEHHRDLLVAAGVPEAAILVEGRSASTQENVDFGLALLDEPPRTVLAVVKRHHRRALLLLAHACPTIERICVAAYDPPDFGDDRERREHEAVARLVADGLDPLVRDEPGWVRSR